ncbi:Gustatory receptor 93 [Hyalella azteca]|uniref:Gustatory receptor 93 n=1 Tax=Hyalella azteca TaxID=294128 RepID=A0A6A0GWN0_HYAAZ|nr:Gustatory receptor 93 [Hyalella azteca]
MRKNSLQRWFAALKFMGLYLERGNLVAAPDHRGEIARNVDSYDRGGSKPRIQAKWIDRNQTTKASFFGNLMKLTWYLAMNALYLACSFYVFSTRDYSDGSMNGIFFIAWYVISPVMVTFSSIKCLFSQRTFTELSKVIASIYCAEPSLAMRPNKFTPNSCLVICLAAARTTQICLFIKNWISIQNLSNKDRLITLCDQIAFCVFWALSFVLILSFNFYVGVLTERLEETSDQLVNYGTSYSKYDTVMETYPSKPIPVPSIAQRNAVRPQPSYSSFLRGIERQLLLIDQAIELITRVYSWTLIFLTIWFLTDLLFGIYLLMTPLESKGSSHDISVYLILITEALCFLFLMNNPADALTEAEEEFMVNLRMFIYRLPDEELLKPYTGIVLSLLRPRQLTLCNFGTVGRSSFLNTLAFMLSYVVVIIQFRDALPPAQPSTLPANATVTSSNAPITPN